VTTLVVDHVSKRFGTTSALDDVSLEVADGEVCVVLGPSGCGKSTLLRVVAGLETADSGQLQLHGRPIGALDPRERDVAMVFQQYALYPHLRVRENLAFPLRVRGVARDEVESRVAEAARLLGIRELLDRRPEALSGGQRQRVAIGRAIVRRPALFLLDEPLSNLDAQLRARMRVELAELFRRLGTAVLYVTHDQTEAMTLGDRIVLMRRARVEQVGPPRELYDRPATVFAAGFVGTPPMNLVDLEAGGTAPLMRDAAPEGAVTLGVRPEDLWPAADGRWRGTIELVEHLGAETLIHLGVGGQRLQSRRPGTANVEVGQSLRLDARRLHFFDRDGHRLE
jgi:ABC-type sugar transport system ATPase subunit